MARGFVPALISKHKEMNIFKTLLRIKEPNELRAALEDLAQGFEYDSQYARHNKWIESDVDTSRSDLASYKKPDDNFMPDINFGSVSSSDNSPSFGGFGGGDFGGGGSGGDW